MHNLSQFTLEAGRNEFGGPQRCDAMLGDFEIDTSQVYLSC